MSNSLRKIKHLVGKRHIHGLTSAVRVLPDFLVIGVVRSGTTSLYHNLDQHPNIVKSAYDELGYFDSNFHLGLNWYRSMFPTKFHKKKIIKKYGKFLTYDVTPFYIYNEMVPKRIHNVLPNIKLIAVLRNPVDRAYSNFHLSIRESGITEPFEKIVEDEKKIIKNINKDNDEEYYKFVHDSMLARGFYAEQLERWYKIFPKEQILIIKSEELATETNKVMNEIFQFLGLKEYNITHVIKKNKADYVPMNKEIRKELIEYFKPYNEKLYSLINKL